MNLDTLKRRLLPFGAVLLNSGETGPVRVISCNGQVACDFELNSSLTDEQILGKVTSVLSEAREAGRDEPLIRTVIHVLQEAIVSAGASLALVALAEVLGAKARARIIIHLDERFSDWDTIKSLAVAVRQDLSNPRDVGIELVSPFREFSEEKMVQLFDLGVRIRIAAGWDRGCEAGSILEVDPVAVRRLSKIGFRALVEWYVSADSIGMFEQRLPNLLTASFCSGFSLPLLCENPYYRPELGFPEMPDALEYCRFLARVYKEYPYYDDVFYPLNFIALIVKDGGWEQTLNIPTQIQLVVDGDGCVGVYRQCAAQALTWTRISELKAARREELRAQFLEFIRCGWNWHNRPYCCECGWRYMCGGLDVLKDDSRLMRYVECMCAHRKLFLEHFGLLRAPDFTIGEGQMRHADSTAEGVAANAAE